MNIWKKLSVSSLGLAIAAFLLSAYTSLDLMITKFLCGDAYMIEPDAALRAQGVLTDRACGFDSDMVGTLIIFILLVAALGFFLVSLREK